MLHFVMKARDKSGALPIRLENREAHRAYLKSSHDNLVIDFAGPILDNNGQMCGSLIIVKAHSKEDVEKFVKDDPYSKVALFDEVTIEQFIVGINRYDSCE